MLSGLLFFVVLLFAVVVVADVGVVLRERKEGARSRLVDIVNIDPLWSNLASRSSYALLVYYSPDS